jgi:hypothetical protein
MKYPLHSIVDLQTKFRRRVGLNRASTFTVQPLHSHLTLNKTATFYLSFSNQLNKRYHLRNEFISNSYTSLTDVCDVNFLRKEKIYTKLKYSRCPQYDIISGGFAAIFAGFIGFLISEKFGIELVDSGDFYTALMYGIFSVFSLRPLLRTYSITHTPYAPYSSKYALLF